MTRYKSVAGGFLNLDTGKFEPIVYRTYDDRNPAPRPRINTSDEQPALMSYADGKMYTSKAAMRESYKPGGNPQGATFVEIGDDQSYKQQAQANRKPDENLIREATERAYADLSAGRLGE